MTPSCQAPLSLSRWIAERCEYAKSDAGRLYCNPVISCGPWETRRLSVGNRALASRVATGRRCRSLPLDAPVLSRTREGGRCISGGERLKRLRPGGKGNGRTTVHKEAGHRRARRGARDCKRGGVCCTSRGDRRRQANDALLVPVLRATAHLQVQQH